jgi:hypothetical protein
VRHIVTVQAPPIDATAPPRQIELHSGESATFGPCNCGKCGVDLPLPAEQAPGLDGRVLAADEHWRLTNLSDSGSLVVENLENPYEYVTLDPCREEAPIPFELARVTAADLAGMDGITVFGPEPRHTVARRRQCARGRGAARPLLNRRSTYFQVLRMLCERRLAGALNTPLPTSAEIASQLSARGPRVTTRAVDAHIEYVTEKLGLRRGIGRDVLVAAAIRRGVFL